MTETAQLLASDRTSYDGAGDERRVDVSGDYAVIGVAGDDGAEGSSEGSVHVFVRSGGTWVWQAKLISPVPRAYENVGYSVGISGDYIAIGAIESSIAGDGGSYLGTAYIFHRSGSVWTEQAQLYADDGIDSDFFGRAIDIHGDTVIVGANYADAGSSVSGAAYIFTRSGTSWTQQQKLTPSDPFFEGIFAERLRFSDDGTSIIISAQRGGTWGESDGSAYVFIWNGSSWVEEQKLVNLDGDEYSGFGRMGVDISGDTAIVGGDDKAWTFTRSGGVWSAGPVIEPAASHYSWGRGVAIQGAYIAIGGWRAGSNGWGAVATFYFTDGQWVEQETHESSDTHSEQWFGQEVQFGDGVLIIGAPKATVGGVTRVGAAYIFEGP